MAPSFGLHVLRHCVVRVCVRLCSLAKLLMDFRQTSHRLGGLARMRRIVPGFSGESGFCLFVRGRQFLMHLGVALVFEGMFGEMFGELEVIAGRLVGLGDFLNSASDSFILFILSLL